VTTRAEADAARSLVRDGTTTGWHILHVEPVLPASRLLMQTAESTRSLLQGPIEADL
jgi:hypothetical protein